jgi:polyisoprenoid-binding protein YceI
MNNSAHILVIAGSTRPDHDAPTTSYQIDPAASRVEFTIGKRLFFVMHLLVTGRFSDVRGTIALDEGDPANSWAEVTIGTASVNTGMGKRDQHLRQTDFFDVARHPHLTFVSRSIAPIDRERGRYSVRGDLTIRGVTREVALDARYTPALGEEQARRIKLALTGAVNRRDFGMVWNNPLITVPDDLAIALQIEATRA